MAYQRRMHSTTLQRRRRDENEPQLKRGRGVRHEGVAMETGRNAPRGKKVQSQEKKVLELFLKKKVRPRPSTFFLKAIFHWRQIAHRQPSTFSTYTKIASDQKKKKVHCKHRPQVAGNPVMCTNKNDSKNMMTIARIINIVRYGMVP